MDGRRRHLAAGLFLLVVASVLALVVWNGMAPS